MAKTIPRAGSRRNVRIGSRKSARRIPKGVIHVQASFNNTIVAVTYVRGHMFYFFGHHLAQFELDKLSLHPHTR